MQKADHLASLIQRIKNNRCAVCGKPGEYDPKTNYHIKGLGVHHLLSKSVFPHLRYEPLNLLVLCVKHHLGTFINHAIDPEPFYAHEGPEEDPESRLDIPNAFDRWLQSQEHARHTWIYSHKNDRQLQGIDISEIFLRLKEELETVKSGQWMDNESCQINPNISRHGTKRIT